MDWAVRYRPTSLSDLAGNSSARQELNEWARTWGEHKEPVILHGPAGVGKTTAAKAIAKERDWDIIEMNASDKRTKSDINEVVGETIGADSVFYDGKLIIIDEADNFHGNSDRGGSKAITRLVDEVTHPTILIANDYYDMSRTLRNKCREIEFSSVDSTEIAKRLRDICEEEGVEYDIDTLKRISEEAEGDVRGAIINLQSISVGRDDITNVSHSYGSREKNTALFDFLDTLFKKGGSEKVISKYEQLSEAPPDLQRWVEENVHRVYDGEELSSAYDSLARSDVWLGRVRESQEYKYWKYSADSLTAGIVSARDGEKGGWTRYRPPKWSSQNKHRKSLIEKIAPVIGASITAVNHHVYPYLQIMTEYCKNRELVIQMVAVFDLTAEEVAEMTGSGKNTNKVQEIIEEGQSIRAEEEELKNPISFEDSESIEGGGGVSEHDGQNDGQEEKNEVKGTEGKDEEDGEDEDDDGDQGLEKFM